ncbi:MAG: prolyl oligopeptidase family serine peptidase, partial [Perlabentimonas sp.]
MNKTISVILLLVTYLSASFAQDELVEKWLVAGPIDVYEPAMSSVENVKGNTFKTSELLKQPLIDHNQLLPKKGSSIEGTDLIWTEMEVESDSSIYLSYLDNNHQIAYLSAYIEAKNFWKGNIGVESTTPFEAYIGETKISSRYTAKAEGSVVTKEFTLLPGKHNIILKVLLTDTLSQKSRFKVMLKPSGDFLPDGVVTTTNAQQPKTLKHLLQGPKLAGTSISATGDMALFTTSEIDTKTERNSYYRRVVRLSDGKLMASFRQSEVSHVKWMPKGNKLSYMSSGDIWIYDFDRMTEYEAIKGLNDIAGYNWSPTEQFIVYYVTEEAEDQKGDMRRILSMEDRQPNWRDRRFLYVGHIESGKHERVTWGNRSTWLQDISPDGINLLISISNEDYSERPYRRHTLVQYNLNSKSLDTLWANQLYGASVSYSPDGKKLLAIGAPLAFGDLGVNVSDGKIPNGYDSQAYIYDIASGEVDPITLDFNPSVQNAHWCPISNNIYLNTVDKDKNILYEFNVRREKFSALDLSEDMIASLSFARDKQLAVYSGSGMNSWPKAYLVDLKKQTSTLIDDPDKVNYNNVKFGDTQEWSFTSNNGQSINGRYYLPPNFDASKKYPTIVYYYGGTSPVGRDFGGRYPKELYAANGFVVLVVQPSGAIGFGQDFSAAHINAWGETTANEIIEGTNTFIKEHSFVDKDRVGCMGASYGGFMTMYLLTQTD